MADCDPAGLLAAANDFEDLGEKRLMLAQVALLIGIYETANPGADVAPGTLINDSRCYACLSEQQLEIAKAQLLCEIATV